MIERSYDQISLEIASYFSIFGCLRGGSAEYEDPRRKSKIIQNLYIIFSLQILINHRIS